ncbi:MAG: hypothetical protein QXZ02_04370 [Candidatus Bathyarchaeia archaeon]
MPFKYIIKWHRTQPEKLSVEAYHKYPHTEQEKHKPAFIIGKAEGAGIIAIRHMLEKTAQKFPTKKYSKTIRIILNESDDEAYETAYRIGLAAALINRAQTTKEIQKYTRYIQNAMPEEIWFWTSKLLNEEVGEKAIDALAILSGATKTENEKTSQPRKGTFWPLVRQRIQQKALQLYLQDNPETKTKPTIKELHKKGYFYEAKLAALKEIKTEMKTKFSATST